MTEPKNEDAHRAAYRAYGTQVAEVLGPALRVPPIAKAAFRRGCEGLAEDLFHCVLPIVLSVAMEELSEGFIRGLEAAKRQAEAQDDV